MKYLQILCLQNLPFYTNPNTSYVKWFSFHTTSSSIHTYLVLVELLQSKALPGEGKKPQSM